MKKKLLFATIILVLLAGVLYYISLPDYLVFNSMSFSNGANRDTELQVIVQLVLLLLSRDMKWTQVTQNMYQMYL